MGEIGQRGEQRPVRDRHPVGAEALVGPGHVAGHQRATDTVTDQMHLRHLAEFAGDAHDLIDAFEQVVVEAHFGHLGARILPARDEDRKALIGEIFDQALFGVQIEDVELVDPRRDDDDRHGVHRFGGRRVVDQFDQAVAENDLARRHRQILANGKGVGVDHLDVPRLDVAQEVLETAGEALAAGRHEAFHGHRVEPEEIVRGHHIEPLAQPERGAPAFLVRQAGGLEEHVLEAARERQVPLLDDVPGRCIGPDRIGETDIFRIGYDHVRRRHAERPPHHVRLQRQQISRQRAGSAQQFLRMHHPGHLGVKQRGGHAIGVGGLADRHAGGFQRAQAIDVDTPALY